MELQDRKMKILQAIIRNYLETGEPVGSRTISKYTDLKLSSATIRNEMADLEEMGLIMQPHTSAGRIPTDAGYRLYVDNMLGTERRQVEDMKSVLLQKQDRLENLLQQVAKLLAANTNYASMISSPVMKQNKIKFIQLSQVDEDSILAVIVLEGNLIRNRVIPVDGLLDAEQMLRLNMLLNTNLCGLPIEEITLGLIESIKRDAGIHTQIVNDVFDAAAEIVRKEEDLKIYTSGANNIFRYPELADHRKARREAGTGEHRAGIPLRKYGDGHPGLHRQRDAGGQHAGLQCRDRHLRSGRRHEGNGGNHRTQTNGLRARRKCASAHHGAALEQLDDLYKQ